jgi:acetamidase/formamidase
MAKHHLDPAPWALHGYFSCELAPALTIDSGDVVSFRTLDSGWGAIEQEVGFSEPRDFVPRDVTRDAGSAEIRLADFRTIGEFGRRPGSDHTTLR